MSDFLKIFRLFLIWRCGLFIVAFLAPFFIKEFGARFPYYKELIASGLPYWIWSFGNFDGVYYLRIAQNGYQDQYSQAFFPIYSAVISLFTWNNLYLVTSLILSNVFFLFALFFIYKLFKLDYSKETSIKSVILLLVFPTSFYFGAVYPESLFLLLTAGSVFLIRKKQFLAGGFFAALSSGTKIFGIFLSLYILVELYLAVSRKEIKIVSEQFIKGLVSVFLAPLGTLVYVYYLKVAFNNPLYFLTAQPAFGAQRSDQPFILLPQVIFRYLKILSGGVSLNSLAYFNAFLELTFTLVPIMLLIIFFKKIRFSYWILMITCTILPTLTGTLSSMPRYVLTSFLLLPVVVTEFKQYLSTILVVLAFVAIILVSLYTRGYWVA